MHKHLPQSSGIYIIESIISKKAYVGSAKNIRKRVYAHFYFLKKNKHHSKRLQSFINKHGYESVIVQVLEECDVSVLFDKEQYWIDKYNSYINGFNGTPEAQTHKNKSLTTEHRQAISIANKGRKKSYQAMKSFYENCLPAAQSEKARVKRSMSHKGKKMSKSSLSKRSNTITNNGGLKKTDYQRQVASETMKRLHQQKLLKRKVYKLTDDQVSEIRLKSSRGVTGKSLAEEYGVNRSVISRIIHNKLRNLYRD